MNKRLILIMAAIILIVFNFTGCRKQGSASSTASGAESKVELNSESGAVSRLTSDGKLLESQVSGTATAITSGI